MNQHTLFGDLRQRALAVYRVHTQSSIYILGIHEVRGRKYVVVRGQPDTDREQVVVRDSDPRIGEASLFETPVDQWPGRELEVATMVSSTIVSVAVETDAAAAASVGGGAATEHRNPWARPEEAKSQREPFPVPRPPGFSESPRIVPGRARGTNPAAVAARIAEAAVPEEPSAEPLAHPGSHEVAHKVVVGQPVAASPEPETPYPLRHVRYAENVAALLRSISRRDRLFEDLVHSRELRDRLRRALDDSAVLLEAIRRRDRA